MSTLDGASLSSAGALSPLSITRASTQSARNNDDTAVREQPTDSQTTRVALGYEYAQLAVNESSRVVQREEQLQKEREERNAAERQEAREAALRQAREHQVKGQDEAQRGLAATQGGDERPGLREAIAAEQTESSDDAQHASGYGFSMDDGADTGAAPTRGSVTHIDLLA